MGRRVPRQQQHKAGARRPGPRERLNGIDWAVGFPLPPLALMGLRPRAEQGLLLGQGALLTGVPPGDCGALLQLLPISLGWLGCRFGQLPAPQGCDWDPLRLFPFPVGGPGRILAGEGGPSGPPRWGSSRAERTGP